MTFQRQHTLQSPTDILILVNWGDYYELLSKELHPVNSLLNDRKIKEWAIVAFKVKKVKKIFKPWKQMKGVEPLNDKL